MFGTLKSFAQSRSLPVHIGATLVSFAVFQGVRIQLDAFYAASGHPVDFATGQLAFNGETILGYYDAMRAGGTFGMYVQTQLFDFLFIAAVIVFGVFLGTLIARLGAEGSAPYKLAIGGAFFAFLGASFDALENLMSFVLMQFASAIPNVLAIIYSCLAAMKFACLTVAMALALCALVTGVIGLVMARLR